ncbi:relA-associated inhibitor-like [Brachionus plicatilis]|uniref:RelA-associated inhibitor-like n=1 Tax=Brachionus plicatilis TaxID=10195 RepID=A0A3M7QHY9_BRAPC|nr:relA-associated inhibitor-like [Brachionus plicatilis]
MRKLKENVASQTNFDKHSTVSNNFSSQKTAPNISARQSGLLDSNTENLPGNLVNPSEKKFDNSTPREIKSNFYLNENPQEDVNKKTTDRNSRMSRMENEPFLTIDTEKNAIENDQQNSSTKLNETYRIKTRIEQKFPKLYDRQKFFWAAATIVKFIMRIKIKSEQTAKMPDRTGSASVFRIRLLEIMTAVHRVYLEPEGPIYSSLMNFIANENDMNALFDVDSLINSQCIQTLCQNVEEICQRISEFMPKEGIIGTTAKSALLTLISEGNKFPENYFWDGEKERLKFDENGKIRNINRGRAILILMSAMISRGLITTLLIKPIKFRLLRGEIPPNIKLNIKILATVMCFIVRKVNNNTDIPLDFPWEWQSSLFNDIRMKPIYESPDVVFTVEKCRKLFVNWANEYINRLDETAGLTR